MGLENVKSMDYNENSNVLTVTYQGGTVCQYRPVNPENYAELVKANCLSSALQGFLTHSSIVGVTCNRGN